jgi:DNA-binding response OmpR family regulator
MTSAVRILVVDEEEPLTHVLTLALELEDWVVQVVADGASVREAVASFEPHIILLDMMLPDTTGLEVVADLREIGVTTPVVFLTGRASDEDRIAAYAAGGDDYITKPFGLEEVVHRLAPIVRRLGLAPTSRRYSDLVLDDVTDEVWRGDERIILAPLEVEVLRALVASAEHPQSLLDVLRSVTARGARIPRELVVRMLERVRSIVNGTRAPLVHLIGADRWMIATA